MPDDPLKLARAEDVWRKLRDQVIPGRRREITVEAALGSVLARDAHAAFDYPPFDRSVMDGYAVNTADFSADTARLRSVALVRAAAASPQPLSRGTCVQINTGAPIPPAADAVVIVENTQRQPDDWVLLTDRPRPGQSIERRGALMTTGQRILSAGARISGGGVAALIAAGVARVMCFARPQVALLSTGDELASPGAPLRAGEIHDSNGVMLEDLVRRAGGEIATRGHCGDDQAQLRASLELGMSRDVLCVTGGMSKGSHDLVPDLLERLGVNWLVTSLNLKPGKPTRIGRAPSGAWVIGLPGNPVSCAVCFHLFATPIIRGLQGLGASEPPRLTGELLADVPENGPRPMYHPARWLAGPAGQVCVSPLVWRGSGDPFGLADANALIYRESHEAASQRGDRATFIPIEIPA